MLKKHLYWLLLLGLAACVTIPPATDPRATVAGKVSLDGQNHAGVEVLAWPVETPSLTENAPYRSRATNASGQFVLQVPPGEYYLLASGTDAFAYYGRNPVYVPAAGLSDLKIGLVRLSPVAGPVAVTIESGVSGTVLVNGTARSGAVVYVYTDLSSRLKGMGYALSAPTDENGRFEVALPAGTYYLLVRLRKDGGGLTGPLRAGDYIGYAAENPLRVGEGQVVATAIPLLEVPEKIEQMAGNLFGGTSVRGRIVTRAGQPVRGARAILYSEPQMLNRPLYVSQPTDADGRFVLSFPQGGTYYLAARQQLGGAPVPGELYGTYDETRDHSLTIATGASMDGIELQVEEMW